MIAFWLLGLFWLIILGAMICDVWINRNYPDKVALIARAEDQHKLLMRGDDRGLYGQYPHADLS